MKIMTISMFDYENFKAQSLPFLFFPKSGKADKKACIFTPLVPAGSENH